MPADSDPLSDFREVSPEEMIRRAATGVPGGPAVEVGLVSDRFAASRGRPAPRSQMAMLRALGGVSYPASRDEVVAQGGVWLGGFPHLRAQLEGLPDITFGGELEVVGCLQEGLSEPSDPLAPQGEATSSGGDIQVGGAANE